MSIVTVKTPAPADWQKAHEETEARLIEALTRNAGLRAENAKLRRILERRRERDRGYWRAGAQQSKSADER